MLDIIKMISDKYLIGEEKVELLSNGNILFTDNDENSYIQTKLEFINEYIDFLTDLVRDNRQYNNNKVCINILDDLKMLYEGIETINLINSLTID